MDPVPGAATFQTSGAAYDLFMGRYSRPLAAVFADSVGIAKGGSALDVGCGPGALTQVLVDRLVRPGGTVAASAAACPGVNVRLGRAEAIPFDDDSVDAALAQLVLHFVSDPTAAASEMRRVVRPGGIVAACVWDFERGMQMLRHFWDAALTVDPAAPDEANVMRFGQAGEIGELFGSAGIEALTEKTIEVTVTYRGFDELWSGLLAGIGPAGSYCVSLDDDRRASVRQEMFRRVGSPNDGFALTATARSASGRVPR